MKYTIKFIDNVMLSPADGRKVLVNFAKGETFRAQKIGEANGLAVFGFQRDGIPFSIIPDTMQNKVLLIPQTTDYTTLPSDIQDIINNNPSVGNMIGTPGSSWKVEDFQFVSDFTGRKSEPYPCNNPNLVCPAVMVEVPVYFKKGDKVKGRRTLNGLFIELIGQPISVPSEFLKPLSTPETPPSFETPETPLSGLGLTPTSALLVGGLVLLSFYIIFKK